MSQTTGRTCPKCDSRDYTFRSRKQIEATPEQGPEVETKYRCKGCNKDWMERVPGTIPKRPMPPEESAG
jgi:transposase-like protein